MKTLSQDLAEIRDDHEATAKRLRDVAGQLRTAAARIADDPEGFEAAKTIKARAFEMERMALDEASYALRIGRVMDDHELSCGCCGHPLNQGETCDGDCSAAKCRAHGRAA